MHSNSIRCLIVEDEPLAAEVLEDFIRQIPYLELVASCRDALFALEVLNQESIDLMFLDIHLPKLKGLDFLKTIAVPPKVILTTAYHQYALQGYELNVLDYLLKPIEFDRFLKAVQKFPRKSIAQPVVAEPVTRSIPSFRFFNINKKMVRVNLDEILYLESQKEYIKIITAEKRLLTKFTIGEMLQFLNDPRFIRIHRSFIINLDNIESYSATEIEINGQQLPIGRSYQIEISKCLKAYKNEGNHT